MLRLHLDHLRIIQTAVSDSAKRLLVPLLITPLILVIGLLWAQIPYEAYHSGGKWLSSLLQPATIAFAIPLYKYYNVLKNMLWKFSLACLAARSSRCSPRRFWPSGCIWTIS
ncbi:hypothetical protein HMSSN139_47590 [Paenibacillus sp. HMSSN-139]|nr:hypothetical protein HMSSN139_47590 [Paenibacillus sp. HMSSN-139]